MKTQCPHCNQLYEVESHFSGTIAKCENCGQEFVIDPLKEEPPPQLRKVPVAVATQAKPVAKSKTKKKMIFAAAALVVLALLGAAYAVNERYLKDQEENNRRIIEEALLDLMYPSFGRVVFKSFIISHKTKYLHTSGYIYCTDTSGVRKFPFLVTVDFPNSIPHTQWIKNKSEISFLSINHTVLDAKKIWRD